MLANFHTHTTFCDGKNTPEEMILAALEKTPCTDAVVYEPRIEALHQAENAQAIGEALYGGMPFQFGFCNGVNTKLNCLEFHRDSEFNLGTEDFILLVAKQDDIIDGVLDTAKVVIVGGSGTMEDPYVLQTEAPAASAPSETVEAAEGCCIPGSCTCCDSCTCGCK